MKKNYEGELFKSEKLDSSSKTEEVENVEGEDSLDRQSTVDIENII